MTSQPYRLTSKQRAAALLAINDFHINNFLAVRRSLPAYRTLSKAKRAAIDGCFAIVDKEHTGEAHVREAELLIRSLFPQNPVAVNRVLASARVDDMQNVTAPEFTRLCVDTEADSCRRRAERDERAAASGGAPASARDKPRWVGTGGAGASAGIGPGSANTGEAGYRILDKGGNGLSNLAGGVVGGSSPRSERAVRGISHFESPRSASEAFPLDLLMECNRIHGVVDAYVATLEDPTEKESAAAGKKQPAPPGGRPRSGRRSARAREAMPTKSGVPTPIARRLPPGSLQPASLG